MPDELFEVWVEGAPIRLSWQSAQVAAVLFRWNGRPATVVPDQSKRPPDEELRRGE